MNETANFQEALQILELICFTIVLYNPSYILKAGDGLNRGLVRGKNGWALAKGRSWMEELPVRQIKITAVGGQVGEHGL